MRVLVITTERDWSMSTQLLLTVAEGLARRGETATACYPRSTATATGAESGFPNVALRSMSDGSFLSQWRAVRRVVSAARPSAVLVHGERDTLLAAWAIGRRGGVVRRRQLGEKMRKSWRTRLAAVRTRVEFFDDDQRASRLHGDQASAMLAWPAADEISPRGKQVAGAVGAVVESRPRLVLFPSRSAIAATPVALRAAAHLLTRHESLRVTLVGDEITLQSTRIHAASLGLADRIDLMPMDNFLYGESLDASAVWVTADGDEGAIALLSAMTRALPVIVPAGSNIESMVVPRITGFVADGDDPTAVVSALARLISNSDEPRTIGAAAASRATRVHNWATWLDRISDQLHRTSGLRAPPRTAHAAATPA